jgi:hypothetical protein
MILVALVSSGEYTYLQDDGVDSSHEWNSELKTEARRIRMLDHSIRLVSPHLPFRPVDWTAIHAAVTDTNLYLRTSKHGIRPPRLYEDVGICIADDVVPALLHQEVCSLLASTSQQLTFVIAHS